MKFGALTRDGGVLESADGAARTAAIVVAAALSVLALSPGFADPLYKYRGEEGDWIYSDRPVAGDEPVEIRVLPSGPAIPEVTVSHSLVDRRLQLTATNSYYAPVELVLGIVALAHAVPPGPDQPLRFILAPQSDTELFALAAIDAPAVPDIRYRYAWLAGDPASEHRPERAYRVPYAVSASFRVSQAYPETPTHTTASSRYAVDIEMPIGTDIHAARGGTVFEVASTHFRGGLDLDNDKDAANLIRILHDDGTYAIYAHLNWNTIRVQPGDVVSRGQYIADSGNTGFSSGPHLHFAVLRNRGMQIESIPVVFEGPNGSEVVPSTGAQLASY
ncbi:MAG: M23 family metallopeptidase [Woeseiaceae bacterium]